MGGGAAEAWQVGGEGRVASRSSDARRGQCRGGVAVLFDVDGVLVDSAAAHRRAWQALGREVGTPFSDELFARTFGQRNASIIPMWLGDTPPERCAALGERKEALYRDSVRAGAIRIYPQAAARMAEVKSLGAAVAIVSSGPRANVELVVSVIGADAAVGVVVAAEDVSRGKPDPEGFLQAAQRLGVPPGRCAVVEDSVHGIAAARAAGMLAVAVVTTETEEVLRAAGAAVLVAEVGGISAAALLARLRGGGRP